MEEGGETQFPRLNLTITPKLGRVVIWPNVLNNSPHESDQRTIHQALPVLTGEKYVPMHGFTFVILKHLIESDANKANQNEI